MVQRDLSSDERPGERWQKVLNEAWPPLNVARTLRDVPTEQRIKVLVRIVFERDKEQQLVGHAVRWTQHHVCVSLNDRRLQVGYVWLKPADVRRATT